MAVTPQQDLQTRKLADLCEQQGMTIIELAEMGVIDSLMWAICMNEDCDQVALLEPDQDEGYCEECETNSMKSALILMNLV